MILILLLPKFVAGDGDKSYITSKKVSLYVFKLLLNHFSRSINSFLEARAASLILKGEGIISKTDDRIYKTKKNIREINGNSSNINTTPKKKKTLTDTTHTILILNYTATSATDTGWKIIHKYTPNLPLALHRYPIF